MMAPRANKGKKEYYLNLVSRAKGIPVDHITGKARFREIVEARHLYWYALRKYERMSLSAVALANGVKTHATIKNAVDKVEHFLNTEKDYAERNRHLIIQMEQTIRIYVAGKVSGEPYDAVVKKFSRACLALIERGYMPVSPVDIVPPGTPWTEAMKLCIRELTWCNGIYLLKDYKQSPGAMLEANIARQLGLSVIKR